MKVISLQNIWLYFFVSLAITSLFFIVILISKFNGNITGFYRIGYAFKKSPLIEQKKLFIHQGKAGNDGQQFLTLAVDPFLLDPSTASALDNPHYRARRIMYPLLGYIFGAGSQKLIIYSLTLINLIAAAAIAVLFVIWLKHYQQTTTWAFSILAIPSVWIVISLSTSDLLCASFSIAAISCYRKQKVIPTAIFVALAILTRETALLLLIALTFAAAIEKKYIFLRYIWLSLIPFIGWSYYLSVTLPAESHAFLFSTHFGYPLSGIVNKMVRLINPVAINPEYVFDFFSFSLLIIVVIFGAATAWKNQKIYMELTILFLLQIITLSIFRLQILDRFPDYTRVCTEIYLYSFMMLPWGGKFFKILIPSTGALVSFGYIIGFLLEPI